MPTVLYITTQYEGEHHSSISAVFGKYLRLSLSVKRVFVTPQATLTSYAQDDLTVPARYKNSLFEEVGKYVDLSCIDFVIIRNHYRFVRQALKLRKRRRLAFLIGFQQSYPFAFHRYYLSMAHDRSRTFRLVRYIDYGRKQLRNRMLLLSIDFFLPISRAMHGEFFPYFKGPVHVLSMGVDPELVDSILLETPADPAATESTGPTYRFVYIGDVSPIREADTILRAFSRLEGDWALDIYTPHVALANHLLAAIDLNDARIAVHEAIPRAALFRKMKESDVGVNLMPDNPVWQTASPTKLMEYYACGLPCLMTPITECRDLFEGKNAGWFCDFSVDDIVRTLRQVMRTPKSQLRAMGLSGRQIILEKRNYKTMSEDLCTFLRTLRGAGPV